MRSVELAKIAAAAEALRLRRLARRQAFRVAYGAGAVVFALACLAALHFLIYLILARFVSPPVSALIVLVVDLAAAGALGYLALQSPLDPIEVEAREIRVQASAELKRSLTVMGMAAEVTGLALRTGTRRGVRRGVASAAAEMATRFLGR